ncbi:isochorismate synthase [Herbiconiux sp. SYSU D00978]|uniref:isochorismate synthase n=1 Tax=Herbiconiux sp. SYSU D00978 TaxID=2812562 RepID=UPI001A964096|nr:chorismate-binding protein [Herbiconiux sp. SYSU D00978]
MPRLRVTTERIDDPGRILRRLDPRHPLLFQRRGQGLAGVGEALRLTFTGPDRITDAAAAWHRVVADATVDDRVGVPGTGLVALGAFAFSGRSEVSSVLVVPRVTVGRTDEVSWVTRVSVDGEEPDAAVPPRTPLGPEFRSPLHPGRMSADDYERAVAAALSHIERGDVEKVVLARDLAGRVPREADLRLVLEQLTTAYPDNWTFCVDGTLGSSPELLVRVDRGVVQARVLAGSTARGRDAESDQAAAAALATSTKDLDEHRYAVESVLSALTPHTRALASMEQPFTLKLPNLWHLASDVEGTLTDGSTSLDLLSALHPTAAVAGTPTEAALSLIDELEPFDRGRYAGPIGWVDANGDGDWVIALRSAQVSPDGEVTAWAGAGVVAESVPERELAETRMKFRPIVEAFG